MIFSRKSIDTREVKVYNINVNREQRQKKSEVHLRFWKSKYNVYSGEFIEQM